MKIGFIPIDNRPVCYTLPVMIANINPEIEFFIPNREILGDLEKTADIDILFVVCTNGWLFEIPKEKITQKTTINLYTEKSKFSCSSEDYSQFLVSFDFINP